MNTRSVRVRLHTSTNQFFPLPSSLTSELIRPTYTLPLVSITVPYLPVRIADRILSRLFMLSSVKVGTDRFADFMYSVRHERTRGQHSKQVNIIHSSHFFLSFFPRIIPQFSAVSIPTSGGSQSSRWYGRT